VLIAHEKLAKLCGYDDYDTFRQSHKEWVNGSLADGNNACDNQWTRSIAVGGEQFVQKIKEGLGTRTLGRRIREVPGGYELRERASYIADFSPQKGDIGIDNTYNWSHFP
jgi:hypothetical protein